MPRRRDQAHAVLALDRLHDIHGAGDRPPAVAGGVHELEAAQPFFLRHGRRIAAEGARLHLEAEQREPVLQARHAEIGAAPGRQRLAPRQLAPRAPQAEGIEAGDDDVALGHQHALHFAQHLVRIGVELQRVRHHHEVDAVGGKGQVVQVGAHFRHAVVAPVVAAKAQRHAVGAQEVVGGQGQLHRVEPKDVGHQQIVL
jgi:hypothetical protein